jgi:hypothetical protein
MKIVKVYRVCREHAVRHPVRHKNDDTMQFPRKSAILRLKINIYQHHALIDGFAFLVGIE